MPHENNAICLNSDHGHHDEGIADSAISPGMAIELAADGKYDQVQSALAEAMKREFPIAKEDSLQGKTIDDAYAQGDRVFFWIPLPGDRANLLVKAGQNITVNDVLVVEAGGSGLWVEAAGTEFRYTFKALESSGGALAANGFIKARRLN